jgi:hypothetical protein
MNPMIEPNNNQEDKLHSPDDRVPLVVLKPGAAFMRFAVVALIAVICFCVFFIILPVFMTGSIAATEQENGTIGKFLMFCIAMIAAPYGMYVLFLISAKYGDYYFFDDRLTFVSYAGRRVEMPYNKMYVLLKNKQRLLISLRDIRQEKSSRVPIWRKIGNWYDDIIIGNLKRGEIGTGIDQSKSVMRVWDNYDDLSIAQKILREKALSFKEE